MAMDPDLVHALHLVAEDRHGASRDAPAPHHVFQTSTVSALMDARYDGDLTVGEVLAHGDLGLGTLAGLDGELIVVDGRAWVARVDGSLSPVPDDLTTPFAVVTPFTPGDALHLGPLGHEHLLARLDAVAPSPVCAVRVEGTFGRLRVRSVPRQFPPYPPLGEVVSQQAEWEAGGIEAVLVGFRFPTRAAGLEVAGWHLHAMARDHSTGGHVLVADILEGTAWVDTAEEVHVELPPGVDIRAADSAMREQIARAESRTAHD